MGTGVRSLLAIPDLTSVGLVSRRPPLPHPCPHPPSLRLVPAHILPPSVSSLPSSSFPPSRPSLILLPCVSSLPSSSLLPIVSGGAISGAAFAGWTSQFLGRRNTIVAFTLLTAVFIPSSFSGLARGARSVQFGMQGAWGIISIHLAEMAPSAFHATFPGVAYHPCNTAPSASAQIKATGGEHLKTTIKDMVVPDYAKVQGIFIGVVAAFVLFITIMGPEGTDAGRRIDRRRPRVPRDEALGARSAGENEKASGERSSTEKPAATPTTASPACLLYSDSALCCLARMHICFYYIMESPESSSKNTADTNDRTPNRAGNFAV
ncbi:hypothetical protein B0H14DRAFT_3867631 [Mycena olivaceomarginata]|nr:hypothetical protein B0H14DRAFT_3867631 [Mycena olivaceomarginata]